jgi:hypothetical protein
MLLSLNQIKMEVFACVCTTFEITWHELCMRGGVEACKIYISAIKVKAIHKGQRSGKQYEVYMDKL